MSFAKSEENKIGESRRVGIAGRAEGEKCGCHLGIVAMQCMKSFLFIPVFFFFKIWEK